MSASPAVLAARADQRSDYRFVTLAPSGAVLAPPPARLIFSADTTVTIEGDDAVQVTLTVKAGTEYRITPTKLIAVAAGTCVGLITDPTLT